jgi:hypothetical protein
VIGAVNSVDNGYAGLKIVSDVSPNSMLRTHTITFMHKDTVELIFLRRKVRAKSPQAQPSSKILKTSNTILVHLTHFFTEGFIGTASSFFHGKIR